MRASNWPAERKNPAMAKAARKMPMEAAKKPRAAIISGRMAAMSKLFMSRLRTSGQCPRAICAARLRRWTERPADLRALASDPGAGRAGWPRSLRPRSPRRNKRRTRSFRGSFIAQQHLGLARRSRGAAEVIRHDADPGGTQRPHHDVQQA